MAKNEDGNFLLLPARHSGDIHSIKSMKTFFATCLLSLTSLNTCLAASASIMDELISESNLQSYYKNYLAAFSVNDLALKMAEADISTYFSYFGSIYLSRFSLLRQMKKYDEAYTAALKTKEIFSTDPQKDGEDYSLLLRDMAEMLMEQGKYAAAEKFALQAVENLEAKRSRDELLVPDLYRVLSRIYVKLGKPEQAVLVLKKAVDFSDPKSAMGAGQQSSSLEELAEVYRASGKKDLAELAGKKSEAIGHQIAMVSQVRVESPKNYAAASLDKNSCALPVYPQEALQKQLRGSTTYRFLIDESGAIAAKYISISSGSDLLDATTLQAYARCKFSPARQDGKALRSWYTGRFIWN